MAYAIQIPGRPRKERRGDTSSVIVYIPHVRSYIYIHPHASLNHNKTLNAPWTINNPSGIPKIFLQRHYYYSVPSVRISLS